MSKSNRYEHFIHVYPHPTYHQSLTLYKYVDTYALQRILEDSRMKVTFRDDANDPYENLPGGENPTTSHVNKEVGFLSMSASNNVPSLWGNYAGKYTGACIRLQIPTFSIEENIESFGSGCWTMSNILHQYYGINTYYHRYHVDKNNAHLIFMDGGDIITKCQYKEQRSVTSLLSPRESLPHKYRNALHTYATMLLPRIIKDTGWEKEEEYRSFFSVEHCTQDNDMYFTDSYMRYITHIIITPRSKNSEKDIRLMLSKTKGLEHDVSIVQANFSRDSFRLDVPLPQ